MGSNGTMTGLFHNKYRIAVYSENGRLVKRISSVIKTLFQKKGIVESYTDSHQMFVDLNVAKAKNCPFDITIVSPPEGYEAKLILKKSNPKMEVVEYTDDMELKTHVNRWIKIIQ